MAFLKDWCITVAAAAIIVGFLEALVPAQSMQKTMKTVTALFLLAILFAPLAKLKGLPLYYKNEIQTGAYEQLPQSVSDQTRQQVLELTRTELIHQIETLASARLGKNINVIDVTMNFADNDLIYLSEVVISQHDDLEKDMEKLTSVLRAELGEDIVITVK
ncbi:stage III sporulation protein AF [Feifania hominis]|nr:stage III sporulation protein AF [Feifania hominis]